MRWIFYITIISFHNRITIAIQRTRSRCIRQLNLVIRLYLDLPILPHRHHLFIKRDGVYKDSVNQLINRKNVSA